MKKSSIAFLAAAVMASSAFAQSNVTVYGVADVGAAYSKSDGAGPNVKSGVMSSLWEQSFIGVKGTEQLGNGLKATFTLEQAIDVATGDLSSAREQNIGLTGAFGTVKAGRVETASSLYNKRLDVMGKTQFSPLTTVFGAEKIMGGTVVYQGAYNGFDFGGSYSQDGTGTTNTYQAYGNGARQETVYSANVGYTAGKFATGYVYTKGDNVARTTQDADIHFVGATYDFGVAKVGGSYTLVDAKGVSGSNDLDVYAVSAQVPVSALTRIDAGYARAEFNQADAHANIYGVQVSHNMSKRTLAYVGYQYVDNSGTSFAALGTPYGTPAAGTNGGVSQGIGAGIRHAF